MILHPAIAPGNVDKVRRLRLKLRHPNLLSDGLAMRPIAVGQRLIDYRQSSAPDDFVVRPKSTGGQRNVQYRKILRIDKIGTRLVGRCNWDWPKISNRMSDPLEGGVALVEIPADTTSGSDPTFSRSCSKYCTRLGPLQVSIRVHGNANGHGVMRIVSKIGARQTRESRQRFAGSS